MARTIRIKIYKFKELSETAKEKAISNLSDINVDYDWWDFIYEDAERIGLKITSFNVESSNYCNGKFTQPVDKVVEAILKEHGEECDTYKAAERFLARSVPTKEAWEKSNKGNCYLEEELIAMENTFTSSILYSYKNMLKKEYEYKLSKEAIIETIEANGYEFTEDGKLYTK